MKKLMLCCLVLLLWASPAFAQGNYVPMDPATLPVMPGCAWYPNQNWPGMYDAWCGSDDVGWHQPAEWARLTGLTGDYGYGG